MTIYDLLEKTFLKKLSYPIICYFRDVLHNSKLKDRWEVKDYRNVT